MIKKFKYNPNALDLNIIKFSDEGIVCQCCNNKTHYYIDRMYTKENIICLCLDCVDSGLAADKFNGTFVEQFSSNIKDEEKIKELICRTPGYDSWQGEFWLDCCDDFCQFIGYVSTDDLEKMGIFEDVIDECLEKYFQNPDKQWVKENLKRGGWMSGYLFKCLHCGKYKLYIDFD